MLLIYYFFVSLEALKCRLSSNKAREPLWIPILGKGVQFTLALLTANPCVLPWEGLRPQHHLINLGFPSHIFSDSKEQSSHVSFSRKPVSLVA